MATEILMPRQGNTVESCLIIEWKKQEGEPVSAGDVLCEVETDKATFDVEAEAEGTLLKIFYKDGADVPVLKTIAVVGQSGEDISALVSKHDAAESPQVSQEAPEQETAPATQTPTPVPITPVASGKINISPRARNLAMVKGVAINLLIGTGPEGRIIERDVLSVLPGHASLTPAAIAALIQEGLHAPTAGSGIGGRVTLADLQAAAPAVSMPTPQTEVKDIPVKGVRKIIAERMFASLQNTAQVTLNASADAAQLLAYRKRLKQSPEELGLSGITITDLVLYAVAKTLPQFPFLNAHFLGKIIREFGTVNLGMAIDTPRGLMVPPINNANTRSLKALSAEAKRLATACQEGRILPDELIGATFTVTNLGMLGVESFTPVLNPPEVGILGVCAIQPKPVMDDETTAFIPHIGLSLTFDHRAVDGAPAARFLQALATALANIDLLLAE